MRYLFAARTDALARALTVIVQRKTLQCREHYGGNPGDPDEQQRAPPGVSTFVFLATCQRRGILRRRKAHC